MLAVIQHDLSQTAHDSASQPGWLRILCSPLLLCLFIGIAVRIFLIVHSSPTIPGDEALTGIQAENILRGLHPIYYYNQPYLGSLEAYILAIFFAIAGPSVTVARTAMMCISLLMIVLTWFLGSALADQAHLKGSMKRLFVFIATLIAAFPPLYDTVLELRSWGGYTEAMIIMLWLLLCTLRLNQRWQAGASHRELTLRWLGFGFVVGLGFWIDPLVVYAVVIAALWLGGTFITGLIHPIQRPNARRTLLTEALFALVAIPGVLVGFLPGIIYGLKNQWANIIFIFYSNSSHAPTLTKKLQMLSLYARCTAPRVIGGSLPTEPYVRLGNSAVVTPGLVISGVCIALAVIAIGLSFFWHHPAVVRTRQLTLMPIVFMLVVTVIFCNSTFVAVENRATTCTQIDASGRYATPLCIVLPFILAAIITLCWQFLATRPNQQTPSQNPQESIPSGTRPNTYAGRHSKSLLGRPIKIVLLLVLVVYFATQAYAYAASHPEAVFKSSGCLQMVQDETAINQYMQQNNIHYAFGNNWIADPITFTTNASILVSPLPFSTRIKVNEQKVENASRYAFLFFVAASEKKPPFVTLLDKEHYKYSIARFQSQPGWDVMIVYPERKISIHDKIFGETINATIFKSC
ncbi:hypothetical protein KDA_33860 [Dictyobacter alpinus]|uniref:Glycosyltransferase RgtA/B/C/D-like domain-containing protein n=1 Tax=Dictyobacter alpinus TaxID=2014873 RepID=A0A402B9C3_9CHLR|nr:hypothetical protein [Dictyobacter alpinus]GCE27902.1 hypothetical protein KDA_33860 [Dictyobacter alpinus]